MSRRDDILKRKPRLVPLVLPEWGDGLFVRALDPPQRLELEALPNESGAEKLRFSAKLISLAIVDVDVQPIFADADLDELQRVDADLFFKAFQQAVKVNGMDAESIQEAAKN